MISFSGFRNWLIRPALRSALHSGFFPYRLISAGPQFNDYTSDAEKLIAVLSNPAVLKVFTLQCDLFSLAKVYVYREKGKGKGSIIKDDPALSRLAMPNYHQGQADFLWSFMFWKMLGNANLYLSSKVVERDNAPMYFMEPHKIEWPSDFEREKDKLIFSSARWKDIQNTELIYRYDDGTVFKFKLADLVVIADMTKGTGNWYKGNSRLDALYKIISNSEIILDSDNINTRFTGKFLVAGTNDEKDVAKLPMSRDEKDSIEKQINGEPRTWQERLEGEKQVHAVRSMIDIKRFVDDLRVLEFDKKFLAQYFLIGSMYGIPRDVLEAYTSSTYENQEKARASHISYTLEPAGEALSAALEKFWGYDVAGKTIDLSWDHLPFTQVMEMQRTDIKAKKINILNAMLKAGISLEEINVFLDTEFQEIAKPESNGDKANSEKSNP